MNKRLVVTGRDASGKSVFVSDERIEPIKVALVPGAEFHRLWGGDTVPSLPADGTPPAQPTYFPPPNGYRFGFFTLPPLDEGALGEIDMNAALQEFAEKLPGLAEHMEPDNPGMHTTTTIDYGVVVSGSVVLELDDGAEVELKTGDAYIQNGTRHRWINREKEPAVIAIAIVGAKA